MADPATNSRFKELDTGVYSELYSLQTQLMYDPATGTARAIFNGAPFLTVGTNKLVQVSDDHDILRVDLTTRMLQFLGTGLVDPVSQQPLDGVSIAGIMTMIKRGYDLWHNENAAAVAAAILAAEEAAAAENPPEEPPPEEPAP